MNDNLHKYRHCSPTYVTSRNYYSLSNCNVVNSNLRTFTSSQCPVAKVNKLNCKIGNLSSEIQALKNKMQNFNHNNTSLTPSSYESQCVNNILQCKVNELTQMIESILTEKESLQRENLLLQKELNSITNERNANRSVYTNEIKKLTTEKEELCKRVSLLEITNDNNYKTIRNKDIIINELQRKLESNVDIKQEYRNIKRKLKEKMKVISDTKENEIELNERINQLQIEIDSQIAYNEHIKSSLQCEINTLKQTLNELQIEITEKDESITLLMQQNNELNVKVKEMQHQIDEEKERLKLMQSEKDITYTDSEIIINERSSNEDDKLVEMLRQKKQEIEILHVFKNKVSNILNNYEHKKQQETQTIKDIQNELQCVKNK